MVSNHRPPLKATPQSLNVEVEGAEPVFMTSCGWFQPPAEAAAAAPAAVAPAPCMTVVPAIAPGANIVAAIAPDEVLVFAVAAVCA